MENKNCYKCSKKAQFNYKSGLIVCAICYNDQICMRKFRSFLRNSLDVFGKTNKLLCVYDGSINSVMLTHMFVLNTDNVENDKKRMFLQGEVIYVDFSNLFTIMESLKACDINKDLHNLAINNPSNKRKEVFIKFMEDIKASYKILSVEDYYDLNKLAEKMNNIAVVGGYRQDYLSIVKKNVIKTYMTTNDYDKVIISDNAQQLATRSLKLMCKSRTNEISQECSEKYIEIYKDKELLIGRPLAEINDREILYYTKINNLFGYVFDDMEDLNNYNLKKYSNLPGNGNMNTLLADFVRNLQGEFVSTASTILKTIKKVDDDAYKANGYRCSVCLHHCLEYADIDKKICKGCKIFNL